ncbi:uncharacterized protein LOC125821790 [Solanum verrucosum]|uniref:uncharacterized protein LOC125821790 n=1 Tax=Solanum verrucosum TaxID=315347 RepID=UPI0020D0550D|nr:uncharacterized protein LOC125821790 [Solanum verrucosum]
MINDYKLALDALTVRLEDYEKNQGVTVVVKSWKADVAELRRDMDELKSIDLSMLFSTVEIAEVSSTYIPATFEVPLVITSDEIRVDNVYVESEVETDEEQLCVREETVYEDLEDLEGSMFDTVRQASLRELL